MKITLHIGVEKTGSTSIQHYLSQNREDLQKQGVLYAESLSLPNNDYLVAFSQDAGKKSDIRARYGMADNPEEIEKFRKKVEDDLRREIAISNPENLIISNEHLTSRLNSSEELNRLFDFLTGFSRNIELIIYLRRQDSLLESLYSTAIKSGNTYDFDTYFQKIWKRHDLHFYSLLKMWEDFVPREKMKVRIFEKEKLLNQDIVDDFLSLVKIPRENKEKIETNISLGYKKTEFLRKFNKHFPLKDTRYKQLRGNFLQLLYKAPVADEKITMSREQRESIIDDYADENYKCAKYFFGESRLFIKSGIENIKNSFSSDDAMDIFAFFWKSKQTQIANLGRKNNKLLSELEGKKPKHSDKKIK